MTKNSIFDGYHRWLASMIDKFIDKKCSGYVVKREFMSHQQLAE